MTLFCNRLYELRREKKLTQKKLADLLCTNNSSICDWEKGRSEPSISQLCFLCKYFDVSADYLLGLKEY